MIVLEITGIGMIFFLIVAFFQLRNDEDEDLFSYQDDKFTKDSQKYQD